MIYFVTLIVGWFLGLAIGCVAGIDYAEIPRATASRRQLKAWRRDRLEVTTGNRRRP